MSTTQSKREKRNYIKKRLLSQDELWKLIIPLLWEDFIQYFLPQWVDQIDFSHKPDFLDKDLKRLMPKGKSKNRTVDILMRVYLKNGEYKTFLLHIEVQAYFDLYFSRRIFQYFYRISDLLQEPIETLAIMIDEDPNYRPNEYIQEFGQTKVHFIYPLFKLLDNPPPYPEGNIFSIPLEVAWHALKQNKLKSDDDLEKLKFRLIKKLVEKKVEEEKIYALLDFINIYLPFENPEKALNFTQNIDDLIFNDSNMEAITIREYLINKMEAQIKKLEGKAIKAENHAIKAENQAKQAENHAKQAENHAKQAENHANELKKQQETTVLNLYAKGFATEDIADILSKPVSFVIEVLKKHFDNI